MKKILLFTLGLFVSLATFNTLNVVFSQEVSQEGIKDGEVPGINRSCLTGMGAGCFSFDKLIRGTGSDIYANNQNRSVTTISQDVILAATYMVGAVLTIVIIWCGLGYIFASRGGKDTSKYSKGLVSAAIGAVLVRGAYAIVRLIQYIAKG